MNIKLLLLNLRPIFKQLYRYALVGLLTNLIGYTLYLFFTFSGISPKVTITIIYFFAATAGFIANKQYTFNHDGKFLSSGFRYLMTQIFGYFLNFVILLLFVDCLNYSHQLVQGVAVFVVAFFMFILSRFFVFAPKRSNNKDINYETMP